MSDSPKGIATLLEEAVALATPAERAAFVERVCGNDAELRQQLEQLIHNHFQAGGFLEKAVDPLVTRDDPDRANQLDEHPARVIGPYKVLEPIGEGGFGVVYMAEQQHPVRRKASLKAGGQLQRVALDGLAVPDAGESVDLLDLDDALTRLEEKEPRKARLVKLRFFAGLDLAEAAALLGISVATAKRDWIYARAWLYGQVAGN